MFGAYILRYFGIRVFDGHFRQVDGAAWTLRGGGSKSDATAPLASSTGAIVE